MLYRYKVSYTFCGAKQEKVFTDLKNAAEYTLNIYNKNKNLQEVKNSLCVTEVQYASQRNMERSFSLQEFPRWSAWFHNVEDLHYILSGK